MKTYKIIILITLFLGLNAFIKSDKIKLEFNIIDSLTNEPVVFASIKLYFLRTKGTKTYEVKREKSINWNGKTVLELEKDIFYNKEVIIDVYGINSMYDTLSQKVFIDNELMTFNLKLNPSTFSTNDTFYVKGYTGPLDSLK